jgi:hypothetical protein
MRLLLASLLSTAAACGGDDIQIPTAATTTVVGPVGGTVNATAATVPTVRITDARGSGVRGVMVRWRITAGGGRVVNDSIRTNGSGEASSGGWTLGTTAGTQTLQATADGVPTVTFTADAAPGPAVRLVRSSVETQSAVVATAVVTPPAVRAEDQFGNGVPDVPVQFSILSGNGSITGATQTTNAQGVATAQAWQVGTQANALQAARAASAGLPPVDFFVLAQPGPATSLLKVTGDNQEGPAGAPVPVPPGVRAVDQFGNAVGNVPVQFTPGVGSGTVSSGLVSTDPANGTAFVGAWTLGPTIGPQTLVATSAVLPGVSATFTATTVATLYDIEVRFVGEGGTTIVRNAFTTAAARWRNIILNNLGNFTATAAAGWCGIEWTPELSATAWNDMLIFARIANIDGPGGILARAGPCGTDNSTGLPVIGIMEFDESDMPNLIANGGLVDVVLHEMGHVIGIGTLWNSRNLLSGAGSADPFFTGTTARQQFASINLGVYSGNAVPVENTGGQGTRDAHWRESIFTRELMTGFYNSGVANPLSRVTAGSLRDMGYTVNLNAADSFSFTASLYDFPFNPGPVLHYGDDTWVSSTPITVRRTP